MEIEFREPKTEKEWEAYYDLRYRILRKPWNQPKGSERNEGDLTAIHFSVFSDDKIIAVARLDLLQNNKAQVRFVAVDENCQNAGIGKQLMNHVEDYAIKNNIKEIELHARENAVQFYLSINYEIVKSSHILFEVIQHYLMKKELVF